VKSIAFDRAADIYDETRGFPPGVAELVADAALDIIGPGGQVLEVGIGTGRIAKPLLARGVPVTGIDLARKMMNRLLETLPPGAPTPALVQADAAALPFTSGHFDAVLSVHVFHLIAGWREALAEVKRVLSRGGLFLTGYEWRPPDSPGTRLLKQWREIVARQGPGLTGYGPGTRDFEDVKGALFEMGAEMEERTVGEWTTARTLARHLETIEHRTWSATWLVPDEFFPQCLAELRQWAVGEYGSLNREFIVPHKFIWQKFWWK